ncbi:hypothetical protein LTR39_005148, partial [Cryomyces antarcticus]
PRRGKPSRQRKHRVGEDQTHNARPRRRQRGLHRRGGQGPDGRGGAAGRVPGIDGRASAGGG